ncbi:cytochrome P450 77A4-like [Ananas comosus]|uniref:Cytochrome P450 77A4-like n=1 Tax=Ananas comosus TaxID=4615 RepID=A0A6P5GTM8_ANACO|nr:cytochrome P450 77A4-like [Ananas comosus]
MANSLLSITAAAAVSSPIQLIFTLLLATLVSLLTIWIVRYNRRYKGLNLPPGPPGWPIVGNLFQVAFSGKLFIHYIRDLRRTYGPILTLRMGVRTLIVVSSGELVHEALVVKGTQFASRPAENTTRNIFSSNKFTVNSAVYGAEWRSLRRNMVSGMLSTTRLREFRPTRNRAMDRFVERMRAEAAASADGASVWVLRNARFAVFCILLAMTFGLLDLDEDHVLRVDAVMKRVLLSVGARMDDYLPFLRPLYARQQAKVLAVRREQVATLRPLIERRRAALRERAATGRCSDAGAGAAAFSYLDSLLELRVEGREGPPTEEELVTLCSEFINGGTDTTATAIEWAAARIIDNPSIQARLQAEIAERVGGQRPVDERDTEGMPYLQAFVKELLRKHPPTYFSLTHAAVQLAQLGGYDVPPDANLEIFLPSISEDPKLWDRPTDFDPDRFLTGGETGDMTGSSGIRMIPFGAGRRICPGLGMGTTHIALMIARMVQAFEWRAHPSQPPIDFKDKVEFTVVMNQPLLAMVHPRNY